MSPGELADVGQAMVATMLAEVGHGKLEAVIVLVDLGNAGGFTLASTNPLFTRVVLEAAVASLERTPDSHTIRAIAVSE